MCKRKPIEGQCGLCQATRLNSIHDKLEKLLNSVYNLSYIEQQQAVTKAFELGKSINIIK